VVYRQDEKKWPTSSQSWPNTRGSFADLRIIVSFQSTERPLSGQPALASCGGVHPVVQVKAAPAGEEGAPFDQRKEKKKARTASVFVPVPVNERTRRPRALAAPGPKRKKKKRKKKEQKNKTKKKQTNRVPQSDRAWMDKACTVGPRFILTMSHMARPR